MMAEPQTITGGVDYSPRYGGVCPKCGLEQAPVITTKGWCGNIRERCHCCDRL